MILRSISTLIAVALLCYPVTASAQDCGGASAPCQIDTGNYHLALPDGPAKGIVMHLHGGGARGKSLLGSRLAKQAMARGYIFVAPDGDHPTRRFKRDWSVRGKNMAYDRDDRAFLNAVMADVRSRHNLPPNLPVLLAGFSRGASFVWNMACEQPDFADAYAPIAGAFWDDLPHTCAGHVRLFHTHGWNDRTVPLEGRSFGDGAVVQGDVWAALFVLRATNGCSKRQPEKNSFDGDLWFRHWTDCDAGEIQLMLHKGGHGAPRGWSSRIMDWFETTPKPNGN